MIRLRRLLFLLVPLSVGAVSAALPGPAQNQDDGRYAFADTTLLRDTLGLSFAQLFPIADSLRMLPDTLRALAVRYGFSPEKLVQLADSMRVPVDSVGVILLRERFNPLSSQVERATAFTYNTTYSIQQTSTRWGNTSAFNWIRGPLFLRNDITTQSDRIRSGSRTTVRQTRDATTETGWKITPDYSIGGRAILRRFDSDDPASAGTAVGENQNEFQLSVRTRQQPNAKLFSEVNVFTGYLSLNNSAQVKRGYTGDLNGKVRLRSGEWLVNEVSGQINGNFARTQLTRSPEALNTSDLSQNLRGSLAMFESGPMGLVANYTYRNIRVESPGDSTEIRDVLTANNDLDATLRMRLDNDRYLNISPRFGTARQTTATAGGQSTRASRGISADGRYRLAGWTLEGTWRDDFTNSEVPRFSTTGGYGEDLTSRTLDGTLSRPIANRITTRIKGSIGLTRYRYYVIDEYPTPPVSRDQYRQSYLVESIYTFARGGNTAISFEVTHNQLVNIPSASTAANNVTRIYAAEWRWTYQLFGALTATQRNNLRANYVAYNFLVRSDRISLDFSSATSLNAVLTPRLLLDVTYNNQEQPSGNYNLQPDGQYYFSPADENLTRSLTARVSYQPSTALSFSLNPTYRVTRRDAVTEGDNVPQRESKNLTLSGNANLNLAVGPRGNLTGFLGRTFQADRSITYQSGIAQPSPSSQLDYWAGNLQFSWTL